MVTGARRESYLTSCFPFAPGQYCRPYFEALDAADSEYRNGRVDVSKMETLLAGLLAKQLAGFYQAVGGKLPE